MGLKSLSPAIKTIRPRLAYQGGDGRITPPPPWKRWYHTARWARLRWQVLLRDAFTCRMCGKLEGDTARLVADHKTPHRGDARLFWDLDNLQTLCADPCHNSVKQAEEQQTPGG